MKTYSHLVFLACIMSFAFPAKAAENSGVTVDIPDDDVLEVLRHLYRWQMDETIFWQGELPEEGTIFLRDVNFERDEGDSSRYVEMYVGNFPLRVSLKKADYRIPELGLAVRNNRFKIVGISYSTEGVPDDLLPEFEHRTRNVADVVRQLYETRNRKIFLGEALEKRLAHALRKQIENESPEPEEKFPEGTEHVFWVAPLSPVSNDLWIFWENAHRLIKFSSDADYDSEAFWEIGPLGVHIYDLDSDVIVAPAEAPANDAMITKDFVGRALYNCIVLGKRVRTSGGPAEEAQ
jgi:hypothetical protein